MTTYANETHGNGAGPSTQQWEPESPFLPEVSMLTASTASSSPAEAFGPRIQNDSPFVAEYAGEADIGGPRAELFAELVSELSDTEFAEALEDLVNEATAVAEETFTSEVADPAEQREDAERAVRSYLQPIARTAEEMIDNMIQELNGIDLASASESEVDALLERFTPPSHDLSPVADQFLGGLVKKAKGAIKAVKKVVGKVTKFLPHNLILGKLKALVRPLLEKVLRVAIDRIPVALRPIAKQLAKRFLGVTVKEAAEEYEDREEAASVDPVQLEEELDTELAGYAIDGEEFERDAAVERAIAEELAPRGNPLRILARSRKRFAKKITQVKPAEDPAPVVEEFVPAILAALKVGINIIGRPRVVKFLAGLVAKLIQKYVGQQQALALSSALVDAGLRLVSLEASEDGTAAAGEALGATVEDTITRLVQDAPEAAWESEDMLAAYTFEAFQQAASAHFPDAEIREDLHEAAKSSGVWTPAPEGGPRKSYKKYSRVLDVTITPQTAASVQTFGGVPLRAVLANRLGLNAAKSIKARAHLFEAIPGTTLGLIALNEKSVPGLGTAGRVGRSLIHPLTTEAASALFGEPGLARPIAPQFLARRGRVGLGQRFYYLEIPGARVRLAPRNLQGVKGGGTRPARSSQPKIVLDFPKREIRLFLFFSETDAQRVTAQLRQKAPLASLLASVKGIYDTMLKRVSSDPLGAVKVIHEAAPTETMESPLISGVMRSIRQVIGDKAREWLLEALRKELASHYDKLTAQLEKVTAHEADGVTLLIAFPAPILEKIRKLFKPGGALAIPGIVSAMRKDKIGQYRLDLQPGFALK
jgi:hypothetical protein